MICIGNVSIPTLFQLLERRQDSAAGFGSEKGLSERAKICRDDGVRVSLWCFLLFSLCLLLFRYSSFVPPSFLPSTATAPPTTIFTLHRKALAHSVRNASLLTEL
jgi:hypothetical protein